MRSTNCWLQWKRIRSVSWKIWLSVGRALLPDLWYRSHTQGAMMQLGMVGLGRMGANMTRRLMRGGHQLVVSDLSPDTVQQLGKEGATGSSSLEDLISTLKPPRAVWIMVPSGGPTEQTVQKLSQHMQAGDAIIDGGNS